MQHHRDQLSGNSPLFVSKLADFLTPADLFDLRTATPYTWTLSAVANGCATNPLTLTLSSESLEINGTFFTARNTPTIAVSTQTFIYATVTFPDLIVTSLTPGELVTLVISPPRKHY